MQVFDQGERSVSNMPYNSPALDDIGSSCFHEIGDLETRRNWCRVWYAPAGRAPPGKVVLQNHSQEVACLQLA